MAVASEFDGQYDEIIQKMGLGWRRIGSGSRGGLRRPSSSSGGHRREFRVAFLCCDRR
jgi:hypothetical protein